MLRVMGLAVAAAVLSSIPAQASVILNAVVPTVAAFVNNGVDPVIAQI
jgi:hypothetical protein